MRDDAGNATTSGCGDNENSAVPPLSAARDAVPPSDIDIYVRFSMIRCLFSLVSLALVATDIPRTGLGLRSLSDVYTPVAPDTFVYFGPYAYHVARIYKHEAASADPTNASSTEFTGLCEGEAIENVDVWSYKFDSLSIPGRALAQHLNVSAYPPCILYREACSSDVLSLETAFAMNDALVTAVRAKMLGPPRRSPKFMFVTTSLWIDRLHHAIIKFFWRHADKRFHSVQYYGPSKLGPSVQVPMWDHLALRLRGLKQQHPNLTFDLTFVTSRTVLERDRRMFIPSVYYVTSNIEMTTLIRGQTCASAKDDSTMRTEPDACTTVLIDDYRYERASMRTDSDAWYSTTSLLRGIGQVYIWTRLLCLWVGCYCARAAEPKLRNASWRVRTYHCALTLTKVPSYVVVYGSWVPVLCYAGAHFIDCAMIYTVNESLWATVNGFVAFKPMDFVVVASVQMRNIWFVALFLKLATMAHHTIFGTRTSRWTPLHGLTRVRGVLIGGVSALTVCAPLRVRAFRDASVTSFTKILDHVPTHSGTDYALHNPAEYGFHFDVKVLSVALCVICAAVQVAHVSARVIAPSSSFALSSRSYLVPFSANTLWSRHALVTYWLPADPYCVCHVHAKARSTTRFRWQSVQGCPTHDSLMRLEQRTKEHWSIARLKNIAMMTDPLVLLRLFVIGQPMYVYRVHRSTSAAAASVRQDASAHAVDDATTSISAAAPTPVSADAGVVHLLLPCLLSDIQDCYDAFPGHYENLASRWELVATVSSMALPWTALVSCG